MASKRKRGQMSVDRETLTEGGVVVTDEELAPPPEPSAENTPPPSRPMAVMVERVSNGTTVRVLRLPPELVEEFTVDFYPADMQGIAQDRVRKLLWDHLDHRSARRRGQKPCRHERMIGEGAARHCPVCGVTEDELHKPKSARAMDKLAEVMGR